MTKTFFSSCDYVAILRDFSGPQMREYVISITATTPLRAIREVRRSANFKVLSDVAFSQLNPENTVFMSEYVFERVGNTFDCVRIFR